MTITATVPKKAYTAGGVSSVFAYPFKISAATDILVYYNGALLSAGIVVDGVGSVTGGNVTITPIPPNGTKILLVRSTTRSQGTDWTANDPDPAESKENAFDKAMSIDQEQDEILARTPAYKVDGTFVTLPPTIDTPVVGQFVQFKDALGNLGAAVPALGTALSNPVSIGQGGTGINAASIAALLKSLGAAIVGNVALTPSANAVALPDPLTADIFTINAGNFNSITPSTLTVGSIVIFYYGAGGNVITPSATLPLLGNAVFTTAIGDMSWFIYLGGGTWYEFRRTLIVGSQSVTATKFWRGDGTWQFPPIHETSGPTDLIIGAIAANQYLQRIGSTVVGVTPPFTSEFISADQTVTVSSLLNVAHGLGAKPKLVNVTLKNTTTEGGFAVGDEVPILGLEQSSVIGTTVVFDATNVSILTQGTVRVLGKTGPATEINITPSSWRYVVRAWR